MAGELSDIFPASEKEAKKKYGVITSQAAQMQIEDLSNELRKMELKAGIGQNAPLQPQKQGQVMPRIV